MLRTRQNWMERDDYGNSRLSVAAPLQTLTGAELEIHEDSDYSRSRALTDDTQNRLLRYGWPQGWRSFVGTLECRETKIRDRQTDRQTDWLTDWLTGWKTPCVTVLSSVERTVPSRSLSTRFSGCSITTFRSRQLIQRDREFCCTAAHQTQSVIPTPIYQLNDDEYRRVVFIAYTLWGKRNCTTLFLQ